MADKTSTITTFIEENHKLLSTLGIFTAIYAFTTNIKNPLVNFSLSILVFWVIWLLWNEIWKKFPNERTYNSLSTFENLLAVIPFFLLLNMFINCHLFIERHFSTIIYGGLTIFLLISFTNLFSWVIKQNKLAEKIERKVVFLKKWNKFRLVFAKSVILLSGLCAISFTLLTFRIVSPYLDKMAPFFLKIFQLFIEFSQRFTFQ